MNHNTGPRCLAYINGALRVLENRSQPQLQISFQLTWVTAEAGYQSSKLLSHFKVFLVRYSSPAGTCLAFLCSLALSGWNINKASLKVQRILKLSRPLAITVTMQCVQHANTFFIITNRLNWENWTGWEAPRGGMNHPAFGKKRYKLIVERFKCIAAVSLPLKAE